MQLLNIDGQQLEVHRITGSDTLAPIVFFARGLGLSQYVDTLRFGLATEGLPRGWAWWCRLFKERLRPISPHAKQARHIHAWTQCFDAELPAF